jgi:hypothetical protein
MSYVLASIFEFLPIRDGCAAAPREAAQRSVQFKTRENLT